MNLTKHVIGKMVEFGHKKADKILVAVSGGMDSMCLLTLCVSAKMNIEVAHINYGLRGDDSDADEALVRKFCAKNDIKLHVFKWSPSGDEKGSTQMQCRDFRYRIFEQLMQKHHLRFTLLAHHSDDSLETFLLDIFNGTGLVGSAGIAAKRGKYLRPLLDVSREKIELFVDEKSIPYRHDQSNFSSNYDRNFIRNEVLPKVEERYGAARSGLGRTIQNLNAAKELLDSVSEDLKQKHLVKNDDGSWVINLGKLSHQPGIQHLLYSWLSEFGFNGSQVANLMAISVGAGQQFFSNTHQITYDRQRMLIDERTDSEKSVHFQFSIDNPPDMLKVSTYPKPDNWKPNIAENVAELDLDLINGENLTIRPWNTGDRFKPLGMHGWKKLSDFFIDEKLSIIEKEEVLLLLSQNEIVWVIAHRIDNRFKVNKQTKNVLRVVSSSTRTVPLKLKSTT